MKHPPTSTILRQVTRRSTLLPPPEGEAAIFRCCLCRRDFEPYKLPRPFWHFARLHLTPFLCIRYSLIVVAKTTRRSPVDCGAVCRLDVRLVMHNSAVREGFGEHILSLRTSCLRYWPSRA